MLERSFRPPHPVDLHLTLGPLRRGHLDPTMRIEETGVWRASRTPDGPATAHIRVSPAVGEVTVRAWGPGAGWAVEAAPALVGALDDSSGFVPHHPIVAELHRRLPGLRIPRSGAVVEALIPSIMEQKVTSLEARRSYRAVVTAWGEPAPRGSESAPELLVPPHPRQLAGTPSYAFHPFGLERKRADAIRRACTSAARLEEVVHLPLSDARRRLCVLPGLGPWTAAEVALVALGDTDAVSIGDYHLPHQVAWALAGERRSDDARMLELLEPYRGHRGRVIRLIAAAGLGPPRAAPRSRLRNLAEL